MTHSMEVSQKTENGTTTWSRNSTPGVYLKKKNPIIWKNTYTPMFKAAL